MKFHVQVGLILLGVTLLFLSSGTGHADLVLFKNGGKLRGIVEKKGNYYRIQFPDGSSLVHKDRVKKIIRETSPYESYLKKKKNIQSDDADALYNLGVWAKNHKLKKFARPNFEKAIQANPDHKLARRKLGFMKYNGEWRTEKEVYLDKGYEKHRGKWLPPAEAKRARGLVKYKGEWLTDEEIMIRKGYVKYRNHWIAKSKRNRLVQKKTLDRIESLKKSVELARDQRDRARRKRDEYQTYLRQTKSKLRDMKYDMRSLKRKIENLKEEIDDLEDRNHRLKDRYHHLKQHHRLKHKDCSGS